MKQERASRGSRSLVLWTTLLLIWGSATIVFASFRSQGISDALLSGIRPPDRFDFRYVDHPWSSYIHIGLGSLFLILGPFQFSSSLRSRWVAFHRLSGRIFVACGLIVGISALYLGFALPAHGGFLTLSATIVFGVIFLYALLRAYLDARARNFRSHREWMIRAYALGLAVSTIRFYLLILTSVTTLSFESLFGPSFWLAFVSHTLIAEWWIHRTRRSPLKSRNG